jgi:hypothetical protein
VGAPALGALPYGAGIFRRRFLLRARSGVVEAWMEDDFHRFRVTLEHDGERVTRIEGESLRYPWTECPGASVPLGELTGMPLSESPVATARHTNPRANCTHMFDVATLAVTHAAAGRGERQYDIAIPDRTDGKTTARLWRDGARLLSWELDKHQISAPDDAAGLSLQGATFVAWASKRFEPERAEAVLALRRACFISMGRARDLDEAPSAQVYMAVAKGSCHSFTEGIAEKAFRVKGTTRDFTGEPNALLADLAPPPIAIDPEA